MEQNRSKIFIIGISILVIVFIGVWIFVISTLLSTSEKKQTLETDIQQEIVYQTGYKEHWTSDTWDSVALSWTNNIEKSTPHQESPQQLSQRAFRMLLPPGNNPTLWKNLVKIIYKRNKIIAIPDIAGNWKEYYEKRNTWAYRLILEHIQQESSFENIAPFVRSEDVVSLMHPSTLARPGIYTQYIPFWVDPFIMLVGKEYANKSPFSPLVLEQILDNPEVLQTNYSLDKEHLIRKKQMKWDVDEYNTNTLTDILLSESIFQENSDLLNVFLGLKQYPSWEILKAIKTSQQEDRRCDTISSLQCLAITKHPVILRGWMSDILGYDEAIVQEIISWYDLYPLPTIIDSYPTQWRGRVVYKDETDATRLAQEWVTKRLEIGHEWNIDMRPHMLSSIQSNFYKQKNLKQFSHIKAILWSLALVASDQSNLIDETLLQVISGDYNSNIRIKNTKKQFQ